MGLCVAPRCVGVGVLPEAVGHMVVLELFNRGHVCRCVVSSAHEHCKCGVSVSHIYPFIFISKSVRTEKPSGKGGSQGRGVI